MGYHCVRLCRFKSISELEKKVNDKMRSKVVTKEAKIVKKDESKKAVI